jgi:hypothetical protein
VQLIDVFRDTTASKATKQITETHIPVNPSRFTLSKAFVPDLVYRAPPAAKLRLSSPQGAAMRSTASLVESVP